MVGRRSGYAREKEMTTVTNSKMYLAFQIIQIIQIIQIFSLGGFNLLTVLSGNLQNIQEFV